jgi:hypothetical protein
VENRKKIKIGLERKGKIRRFVYIHLWKNDNECLAGEQTGGLVGTAYW